MPDTTVEACRDCKRAIRWLKNENGAPVPVEAHSANPRDILFQTVRGHMHHKNFCSAAAKYRRRRA